MIAVKLSKDITFAYTLNGIGWKCLGKIFSLFKPNSLIEQDFSKDLM